jgi:hypothetical protein
MAAGPIPSSPSCSTRGPWCSPAPGQDGHGREVAQEQRGTAHGGQPGAGGLADGLEHEAIGHAGPHLSADDPAEYRALEVGRPASQGGQPLVPQPARPGAPGLGNLPEGRPDLGERQGRTRLR